MTACYCPECEGDSPVPDPMTDQPDIEAIATRHAEKGGKCAVCIELTPPGLRFAYLDWLCDTAIVIERLRAVEAERDRWREDAERLAERLYSEHYERAHPYDAIACGPSEDALAAHDAMTASMTKEQP